MRMKRLWILFIILLLTSCGNDFSRSPAGEFVGPGQNMEISHVLTPEQVSQARSICNALRSKRIKLQSATRPRYIDFNLTDKGCSTDERSSRFLASFAPGAGSSLLFIPYQNTTMYIQESLVQTDTDGLLSSACDQVLNSRDIGIIAYDSPTTVRTITFADKGKYFVSNGERIAGEDEYILQEKITYTVELSSSSSSYGYIKERVQEKLCNPTNSNSTEVTTSKFQRKLTNLAL